MERGGWKDFLIEIFAWWRGNTWGTRLWLAMNGELVGTDESGNRITAPRRARSPARTATSAAWWSMPAAPPIRPTIPPGWYGWMHYRTDLLPSEDTYVAKSWEKPHQTNLTGSPLAYRPDGSLLNKGERPRVTGDYDAWSPE